MRRKFYSLTGLTITGMIAAALFFTGLLSISGSPVAHADGATVINEFSCGITPSASGLPRFLSTTDTHTVITPSGNTVLKCDFEIPEGLEPDQTMNHRDFFCNTFLGSTRNSRAVTTKSGKVHLTCQINGSN